MKQVNLHLISDSSGQTAVRVADAGLTQFPSINARKYNWPLVRSKQDLDKVKEKILKHPGIVLSTLSKDSLRADIKEFCTECKIPYVHVVEKIIDVLSEFSGEKPSRQYCRPELTKDYFDKVDAIEFALKNDDGMQSSPADADIVIIGPSRSSKTPTSIYLAYNGFKTANIPYVLGISIDHYIENIPRDSFVVGLTISAERLVDIRRARMQQLNVSEQTEYTNIDNIKLECAQVRALCTPRNWPVIDVSQKSVEEVSAEIIQKYYKHRKNIEKEDR